MRTCADLNAGQSPVGEQVRDQSLNVSSVAQQDSGPLRTVGQEGLLRVPGRLGVVIVDCSADLQEWLQ
jgi:hypothetical protein